MPLTLDNLKALVEWLGEKGAEAGIERSDLTIPEIRALLAERNIQIPSKASRRDLVAELLFAVTKRINKSLDEMLAMNADELMEYFDRERPSKKELMSVLSQLDFHPGSEAQKSLYKYAARQIAETGMFQRVARKNS